MHNVCRTMRNILIGLIGLSIILVALFIPSTGLSREVDPKKYEKYLPSGNYRYQYGWGVIDGTVTSKKIMNDANYIQVINSNAPDISKTFMIIEETTYKGVASYDDLKVGDDIVVDYAWVKIERDNIEIDMADTVSVPSKIKLSKEEELYRKAGDYNMNCFNSQGRDKKQCLEAIKLYTKVTTINSRNYAAYFDRAQAYGDIGQVENGLKDFKKILLLDPNNKEVYYRRASFYLRIKQCAKAAADFDMDFKINSHTDDLSRAEAYYCSGRYKAAADEYNNAISRLISESGDGRSLVLYYFYRGCAHIKSNQNELGLQDFAKVLKVVDNFEQDYAAIIKPYLADKDIKKFFNLAKGLGGN